MKLEDKLKAAGLLDEFLRFCQNGATHPEGRFWLEQHGFKRSVEWVHAFCVKHGCSATELESSITAAGLLADFLEVCSPDVSTYRVRQWLKRRDLPASEGIVSIVRGRLGRPFDLKYREMDRSIMQNKVRGRVNAGPNSLKHHPRPVHPGKPDETLVTRLARRDNRYQ